MQSYIGLSEKYRRLMLDTLDFLWNNPETGYREWKAHHYLADIFESLGYTLTPAGNIPGFTAEIDTGIPGPTLAIFGEMDALLIPDHPDADLQTGAVHACGHCAQCAALVGIAAALKEPGALEGLCGKIRLAAVPAEELIEIQYRLDLRRQGVIRYLGGKPEFLFRGLLEGVDLCFMVHVHNRSFIDGGSNGLIAKELIFEGVAAHAGSMPHKGVNALYAANLALNAINALRETFRDSDHIRVHPILTQGGTSVNAVPDRVRLESYVRGAHMDAVREANRKVNRAAAGCAAAMGAKLQIRDVHGYWPRTYGQDFIAVFAEAARQLDLPFANEPAAWGGGSSDLGDLSALMPALHPYIAGAAGTGHGADFRIADPETACVTSAKWQLLTLRLLLCDGAARANRILSDYRPVFPSKAAYFAYVDGLSMAGQAVRYREDGTVLL